MKTIRYSYNRRSEQGVVSIFIVVFAAIFMTIITASFITIMITDQQQATSMDLSQSAYDSAMSGVEDAKRALVYCQTTSNTGCTEINDTPAVAGNDCTLLQKVGISSFGPGQGGNLEVPIQTGATANSLDQAYTCVGISTQSPDVQTSIGTGQVSLIPLKSASAFDHVVVSWNTSASSTQTLLPTPVITKQFSTFSDWTSAKNYPPVIQASLITVGGSINQADFDKAPSAGGTGAATLMLRPSSSLVASPGFTSDPRSGGGTVPINITCTTGTSFTPAGPYTCSTTIDLGFPITPGQQAYLALQPIYQAADINLKLSSGGAPVNFSNVQAVVDSTGRANDIFRRVSARVNLVPMTGNYPNATLNLGGSLCKDFTLPGTSPNVYTSDDDTCK